MAWLPDTPNKFHRERITIADVRNKFEEDKAKMGENDPWTTSISMFLQMLERLDWTKTAIYYESEGNNNRHRTGWHVVHATEEVGNQEFGNWHKVYAHTYFGISAMMA